MVSRSATRTAFVEGDVDVHVQVQVQVQVHVVLILTGHPDDTPGACENGSCHDVVHRFNGRDLSVGTDLAGILVSGMSCSVRADICCAANNLSCANKRTERTDSLTTWRGVWGLFKKCRKYGRKLSCIGPYK